RAGGEVSAIWLATPGAVNQNHPTLIAYTIPLDPRQFERQYRDGVHLVPVPATLGVDARVKHRNRLPWWIARYQAHVKDPSNEPLIVEPGSGTVLETPAANVLAVFDGVVVSPRRERILHGVSLGVVEDLCKQLGVSFVERTFTVIDLERASEVLLANSTYCLAGVSRIGDRPVPSPAGILDRLLDAWSRCVGVDVRQQMIEPS